MTVRNTTGWTMTLALYLVACLWGPGDHHFVRQSTQDPVVKTVEITTFERLNCESYTSIPLAPGYRMTQCDSEGDPRNIWYGEEGQQVTIPLQKVPSFSSATSQQPQIYKMQLWDVDHWTDVHRYIVQ